MKKYLCFILLMITVLLSGCSNLSAAVSANANTETTETSVELLADHSTADIKHDISLTDIPAYSGSPYAVVNENVPFFTEEEATTKSFEHYSDLDKLGRCGVAYANVGKDLMPTEKRGKIGEVKPTGWHSIKYDGVDGKYLYNRCHLIAYELTAENANEKNLITGTRYFNVEGMLPFENMAADYVKETGNHVLYRVTPLYDGNNLVANGVLMEAKSVEDHGDGILYNVFVYNIQPGIVIDYATGESRLSNESITTGQNEAAYESVEQDYILNTKSKKFHKPSCPSVKDIKDKNKEEYIGNRDDLVSQGYVPCKICNP